MVRQKKTTTRKKRRPAGKGKSPGRFRFQLGWTGVAGIAVVAFCLFLWMFLLGIWAGQTILLPPPAGEVGKARTVDKGDESPVRILTPDGKKNPVAAREQIEK